MNPSSLERQLLHLDLRKGMNERVRPECGDPSSHLTLMENLQQDQDGCWVKRPGLQVMGDTIATVRRLVKLRGGGLGAIHGNGRFSAYSEGANDWVETVNLDSDEGQIPHFITEVDQVAGSSDTSTSRIASSCSTSKYHYICYQNSTTGQYFVSVFDRATGSTIYTYDCALEAITPVFNPMFTTIANRYVVLFFGNPTGGGRLYCTATDTNSTWQLNFSTPQTLATPGSAAAASPYDVASGAANAYVICNGTTVYSVTTAGVLFQSRNLATGLQSIACSPDKLWVATTLGNLGALNNVNLASTVIAFAAHGGNAAGYIEVNDANRVFQTATGSFVVGATPVAAVETRITTANNGTTFAAVTQLNGWNMESMPFYIPGTDQVYVHVRKDEPGVINSLHAVANISVPHDIRFKADSILEPFNGVAGVSGSPQRYTPYSNHSVGLCVAVQQAARSLGYFMFGMDALYYQKAGQCLFGEQAIVACGTPSFAGGAPRELGFVDLPLVDAIDSATAGNPNGAYRYLAVYRQVDETGAITWSRTSPLKAVTVAATSVDVYITPPALGMRDTTDSPLSTTVELYRTTSGGTIYYLCASSALGTTVQSLAFISGVWYIREDYSDTTLASQALLFRQPGTPNAPLDRYPCPPCKTMVAHKDRIYVGFGNRICYSSFFVDGETPWFHPQFTLYCHGGSGPITGLASMDGRLVVFKRDAVFLIDGDGPPEGGVAGNEFAPPQRIATEYGCVDHRSIQVLSAGLIYRSPRGIELLTRGMELRNLGDRVALTLLANPYTVGSVVDSGSHYRILVCATKPAQSVSGLGCELVYDTLSDCWSVNRYKDSTSVYAACLQDIAMNDDLVCYADAVTGVYRGSGYLDGAAGNYINWIMESGWIRTGQQARQRIERCLFLGKKSSNHKVTIDAAYDYVDSYADTQTWEPDVLNLQAIEEVVKNTVTNQVLAAKFRVTESIPTDTVTYPVTTGKGCDILGLTVKIAVKTGDPKVAAEAKG